MSATVIKRPTQVSASVNEWWRKQAYRHKWAEFLIYFMFVSGLGLWDSLAINWQIERWLLLSHMLIGATLFSLIVGIFWSSHRNLLLNSKKSFLRQTGSLIECLLFVCAATGFYLFFYGNIGNSLGQLIQDVHFYSSWLLAPLVFRHALRWSILKFKK